MNDIDKRLGNLEKSLDIDFEKGVSLDEYYHELKDLVADVKSTLKAEQNKLYECQDCGFEYHKQHEDDTPQGGYTCPVCNEVKLEEQLKAEREEKERYERALRLIASAPDKIPAGKHSRIADRLAREALGGDRDGV